MRKLISIFVFAVLSVAVSAQSTARKFVLQNSQDGQSELTVYLPAMERATGMAVLGCPGGGYRALSMANEGHDWAEYYNAQGIAYVVLKYRMPQGDRNVPLGDAYNAMKTIRDSATVWNINPYAVGIMGFSAGGHLASAVSTHAPMAVRPNFSVLFYPVISMNKKVTHRGSCENFLGNSQDDAALIKEWSSDMAVRRHLTPPAIILTANDDRTVNPATNAIAYYSAMRRAGNDCSLYVYPTGGHGFGFRSNYKYHEQMTMELSAWLKSLVLPSANDKKIACVGNSITDGMGIDMADVLGYPAVLQRRLGEGYQVKNFGVSGRTMLNKGDHPYQQEKAWRDCLDWQPDIVVLKLGTNDTKEHHRGMIANEFATDMQQMIDSLRALPSNPRIYCCSPIPAFRDIWTMSDSVIVNQIMPIIREVAERNQCEYIDLHTLFANDGDKMQGDGIHPTDKGAARIAQIVADALKAQPVYPEYNPKRSKKTSKLRKLRK